MFRVTWVTWGCRFEGVQDVWVCTLGFVGPVCLLTSQTTANLSVSSALIPLTGVC